ncbi:MAG: (d)CMP kinase [Sporomusaceae bacterium]|nr:(d)CMP kinase [Sporomusaceae bacterium]
MKNLQVAIDGPAGAGKSTVAQIVAARLGYTYIDTGAMYRAVTWKVLREGVDVEDAELVAETAAKMDIRLSFSDKVKVFVDGEEVTEAIRAREISNNVSAVAKIPAVREIMLKAQQKLGENGAVVMDGRDIGTHVLPLAEVKVFLTASLSERAKRRYLELKAKGAAASVDLAKIEREIAVRDEQDSKREAAPLVKAEDAVVVDTTGAAIEEVVQKILVLCREK